MLAKQFRLPIKGFPLKARVLHHGSLFLLKGMPNRLPYVRVGVVVTKKTTPLATDRNRLRRKTLDLFREQLEGPSASAKGKDLLVVIKPIKLDASGEAEMFKELKEAISITR